MARAKATVAKNATTTKMVATKGLALSPAKEKVQSDFLRRLAGALGAHKHKSTKGWMYETINPLWNISTKQAQMIFDLARSGNYAQLEYLYNEIETCSPVFSVCVTRRCSAISELDWKVVRSDQRLNRNADEGLIKEQIECLETAMARIDNLPDALDHLALSAFRGFSILNTWRDASGMPTHLEVLDQWNCCHDKRNNKWLWNPDAISFMNPTLSDSKLDEIPREDSIVVTRKRQIDWPAMKVFLREAVGERDWGRFLETYGLPPVIITMPEHTSKEDEDGFLEGAANVFEGRSGVVPFGSEVNFASESRGVNPFTEFIDHQMKLFVLLATGGTLTSLSEAQGIGSGASDAQMDVWKQIVRADVRINSNAINKQLCEPLLKAQKDFKGKPILAEFKLNTEPTMTADQILELAGKAASAGFELDENEISQICGFTVRKKVEGGGMGFNAKAPGGGGSSMVRPGLTFQADEEIDEATTDVDASKTAPVEVLNAEGKDGRGEKKRAVEANSEPTRKAKEVGERLVESLQADFKDVADEIGKILALPEAEQAEAARVLLGKIDTLVPDDPAMAEVIEEQMREAFERQLAKEPEGKEPAKNKVVSNSEEFCKREDKSKPCDREDCPENSSGKNDGKIVFHPNNQEAKYKADAQCRKYGYNSVDDMMNQSLSVGRERINQIFAGGNFQCKPHEAVAVIRSGMKIPSPIKGEADVQMNEFSLRHYVCGERREDNTPKIENLMHLPLAILTIRHPGSIYHKDKNGNVMSDELGKYPKGTQTHFRKRIYKKEFMIASAYTDSGVLSGWRVIKKSPR